MLSHGLDLHVYEKREREKEREKVIERENQ